MRINDSIYENFTCINSTSIFDNDIELNIKNNEYSVRHWSYIMKSEKKDENYYIKIPKYKYNSSDILKDISLRKNKEMAIDEAMSLIELNDMFRFALPNLKVVKFAGYSKKYNALITKKFEGEMLYEKSGNSNTEFFETYYINAAKWLKHFHTHSPTISKTNMFSAEEEWQKFKKLQNWLHFHHREYYNNIENQLIYLKKNSEFNFNDLVSYNLPGFELRNFLFDNRGNLCFLDPGKEYIGTIMDDVARFIVSIDMIRWGKLDAYLNRDFCNYKKVFLNSYFENESM